MNYSIPDIKAREQAIDYTRSFIVQAPAGSGKTSLLTQRFLNLLAHVESQPEEILAITFTRKAAGEMKERIYHALTQAAQGMEPESDYEQQTYQLAKAVIKRDQQSSWGLMESVHRLRITTIDAFCASINQQMPLQARLGAQPKIVEDAAPLYQEAVETLLKDLSHDVPWQSAVEVLLLHLDNRIDIVERLLMAMLATREQWLETVMTAKQDVDILKPILEQALETVIEQTLEQALNLIPISEKETLHGLFLFAFQNLENTYTPLSNSSDNLEIWWQCIDLLLTKDNKPRKSVTKKQGFPAATDGSNAAEKAFFKAKKAQMTAFLGVLNDAPDWVQSLISVRRLPDVHYAESQWRVLHALLEVLPILVAYLKVVFAKLNQVDFNEMTICALNALDSEESPSELALAMDYLIRHVLVDEFQDTSQSQFTLLKRLIQAWQPDEGRTLFLVGDPMQSIYRFRQADVNLFNLTRKNGLGGVSLTPLMLSANFRSDQRIVGWLNEHCKEIFPKKENYLKGSVTYHQADAMRDLTDADGVQVYPLAGASRDTEADEVVRLIQEISSKTPELEIAILVRSRTHLSAILPSLKAHGIPYEAHDLETLGDRPIIQMLVALTFALSQLADDLAWYSVLRAPYVGLTLSDLQIITDHRGSDVVWQALKNPDLIVKLSPWGHKTIKRIVPLIEIAFENIRTQSFVVSLKQLWLAIGGNGCAAFEADIDNVNIYFDMLTDLMSEGLLPARQMLLERLNRSTEQQLVDNAVKVMTIHKSKGLEFDVVILPALDAISRIEDKPLLLWQKQVLEDGGMRLLLAPIQKGIDQTDRTYQYLYQLEQDKAYYEMQRLFYVAVTRAKRQLHLFACMRQNDEKELLPADKRSIFGLVWPVLDVAQKEAVVVTKSEVISNQSFPKLKRLPEKWLKTQAETYGVAIIDKANEAPNEVHETAIRSLESNDDRLIGIIIHRYLAYLADKPELGEDCIDKFMPTIVRLIESQGIVDSDYARSKVTKALKQILEDEQGRWVLGWEKAFAMAENELPLDSVIIDRVFKEADETCWIVDYKTSEPAEGEALELFLQREREAYTPQLKKYARHMAEQGERKIKCMLYFPMLPKSLYL